MSITAKDMYKDYQKRHKRDQVDLTTQLKDAKRFRDEVYERHIKPRENSQVDIPAFIFQNWEHRCKEVRKAERKLKEKKEEKILTYKEYRAIITSFNLKMIDKILGGYEFRLPYKLGVLSIKKIERKFDKPVIDWGETRKLRAQGKDQLVYYTDDFYCRWYWRKKACQVKNKIVYFFKPTKDGRTRKGAVDKLSALLKSDELAHHNFKMLRE